MSNYADETSEGFEHLNCWKAAREFRLFVTRTILPTLPRSEEFHLKDQLRRAARSMTANLAEGHGRYHYQENIKFCRYSRGSAAEIIDHLITGVDEMLVPPHLLSEGRAHSARTRKLINGYIRYLSRAKRADETGP